MGFLVVMAIVVKLKYDCYAIAHTMDKGCRNIRDPFTVSIVVILQLSSP